VTMRTPQQPRVADEADVQPAPRSGVPLREATAGKSSARLPIVDRDVLADVSEEPSQPSRVRIEPLVRMYGMAGNAAGALGPSAYANIPSAGVPGRIFIATDSVCAHWIDDGTRWNPIVGPSGTYGRKPSAAAGWTKVGSGVGALVDSAGALFVSTTSDPTVFHNESIAAGSYEIRLAFQSVWYPAGAGGFEPLFAVVAFETSTGKFTRFGIYCDTAGAFTLQVQRFNSVTAPSTVVFSSAALSRVAPPGGPIWLRIIEAGGFRYYEYSPNSRRWGTAFIESVGVHVTPNRAGVFSSAVNSGNFMTDVLSWEVS
jgi:hypothetical protein